MYWTFGSGREAGCWGSVTSIDLAAGPGAREDLAVGRGRQGQRLGVGRVECHGPGGPFLGGLAEDLPRVAGGRVDRAVAGAGQVPDPLRGQGPVGTSS